MLSNVSGFKTDFTLLFGKSSLIAYLSMVVPKNCIKVYPDGFMRDVSEPMLEKIAS